MSGVADCTSGVGFCGGLKSCFKYRMWVFLGYLAEAGGGFY